MSSIDTPELEKDIAKLLDLIVPPMNQFILEKIGDMNAPNEVFAKKGKYCEVLVLSVLSNFVAINLCQQAALYDEEHRVRFVEKAMDGISKIAMATAVLRLKDMKEEYEKLEKNMKTMH